MQEVSNVQRLSKRVAGLKPSGIRKFFDIAATMKDVISLGIGEPDFTTPKPILDAGIRSLQNGETHYTSNWGKLELRQAIADNLMHLYNVKYDPTTEIIATVGVSEALYLTFTALLDPGRASRLTGVDHSPQFFAVAVALANAIRLAAKVVARALLEIPFFMTILARSRVIGRA